jgi:hypothetical protein
MKIVPIKCVPPFGVDPNKLPAKNYATAGSTTVVVTFEVVEDDLEPLIAFEGQL